MSAKSCCLPIIQWELPQCHVALAVRINRHVHVDMRLPKQRPGVLN